MRTGLAQRGYTIIELLIVLAVTGVLFVTIAASVSGRQRRTEFAQSVNDIRSRIQDVINNVSTGYYYDKGGYACVDGGVVGPRFTPAAGGRGTNQECIYLGRVMHFNVNSVPEDVYTYNIAGLRKVGDKDVATIAEARPRAIGKGTAYNAAAPNVVDDSIEKFKLKYGLRAVKIVYGPANTQIGMLGFISTFAKYSGANLESGSIKINLYAVPFTTPVSDGSWGKTKEQAVDDIAVNLTAATALQRNPDQGVKLCFTSGDRNSQHAIINIGSDGRQLSADLNIYGDRNDANAKQPGVCEL